MNYIEIIKKRRSYYDLSKNIGVSEKQVKNLIKTVILESPTAYNMQSSHVVLLLNEEHHQLWNIVSNTLKSIVSTEQFEKTKSKLHRFSLAKGTLLFFEDMNQVEQLKQLFPEYQNTFDEYASQGMGMLQVNIWNALADIDIGANLQHYNPLIDDEVKQTWNIPQHYRLTAQMVFGHPLNQLNPKEKESIDSRFKVFD